MRILIIDDDGLAAAITAAILEEDAHDCLLAESASEARVILAAESGIDLIICDMQMPETDGLSFFRQLRQEASSLPFVLLTGSTPLQTNNAAVANGAQEACVPEMCLLKDENLELNLGNFIAQIQARDTL